MKENVLIDVPQLVQRAYKRTKSVVRPTILEYSFFFSEQSGANVYFKCENMQHTGSFKT